MMLGPSLTCNFGNMHIDGEIDDETKLEIYDKMLDAITESLPVLINKLTDSDLKANGDFLIGVWDSEICFRLGMHSSIFKFSDLSF